MSARRTAWLVVPLLVGGALGVPAGAAPAGPVLQATAVDAAEVAARLGGTAMVETGAGTASTRTPREALTSLRRHDDTAAWLRSVAAAASAVLPEQHQVLVVVEADGSGEQEAYAAAGPAGDLDGDGLDDVATLTYDAESLVLQGRRGLDGALLWSRDLTDGWGALAFPVGRDLTGDGADDLLYSVTSGQEQFTQEEGSTSYGFRYLAETTTAVGVVSGADGSVAWETTRDGAVDEQYSWSTDPAGVTSQSEYVLRSTALAVLPLVSDDVTGDGVADVALSSVDLDVDASQAGAGGLVAYAEDVRETVRSGTDAVLLDGPTGAAVAGRRVAGQSAVSLLLPVGQVVGDDRAELLWSTERVADLAAVCAGALDVQQCTAERPDATVELELLTGGDLTRAWAVTTTGGLATPFPLGQDVNGDGAADLGLYVDSPGSRFVLLSGAEGAGLWQAVSEQLVHLVGIDAGVAALGRFDVTPAEGVSADVLVERRDAVTGTVLGTSEHRVSVPEPAGDDWSAASVAVLDSAPDADGDGLDELLVGVAVTAEGDGPAETRSLNVVETLADGRTVRSRTGEDLAVALRAGDLDGDGLEDVREDVLTFRPDELFGIDAVSTAHRVVDDAVLWTTSGNLFALPLAGGDHDGVPGEELVDVPAEPDLPLRVRSLRGADLGERWVAAARGAPSRPLPSTG